MVYLFTLAIMTAFAKPFYQFHRPGEDWALDRDKATLSLFSEGATFVLPIDSCTKEDVDVLLGALDENFRRLIKFTTGEDAKRLGTVASNGEKRILRELATRAYAPDWFEKLPGRFVNLMITENAKCPRSFR